MVRAAALSFLLVLAVYSSSNVSDFGDGYLALPTAHSLLYQRDLDLGEFSGEPFFEEHYGMVRVGGRDVDYFPYLTAVFATPVVAAWDVLGVAGITTSSEELIRGGRMRQLQVLAASTVTAAAAVVLALVTRRLLLLSIRARRGDGAAQGSGGQGAAGSGAWLGPDHRWALPVYATVIALGTTLWSTASRALWQHGPSVLVCGSALLCVVHLLGSDDPRRRRRLALAAGVLAGLSYWARPTNAVLCVALMGLLAWRRRAAVVPFVAGAAGIQVLVVAANLVLLGRALPPYFTASRVGWHGQLPEAAAANLVSPARGLFVFSPFLLAALLLLLPRRWSRLGADLQAVVVAAVLGSLGYLLAVSAYGEKWWAGHSYGPRFMTEAVVLLAPLALVVIFGPGEDHGSPATGHAGSRWRLLGVMAIAASVFTHMMGAQVAGVRCWNREPVDVDRDPSIVWDVARPQVLEGARLVIRGEVQEAAGRECAS